MTKVQTLIRELETLDTQETEKILQFLLIRVRQQETVRARLAKYRGVGQGIWQEEAQQYVNQLREDDRY